MDNHKRYLRNVWIMLSLLFSSGVNKFKSSFFTGLIVLLPTGITVFIAWKLFDFLGTLIKYMYGQNMPWWLGSILTAAIIVMSGLLVRNFIGRRLVEFIENLFTRLPFIRSLYSTIKQLIDLAVANKNMVFKKVVAVEYPRKGLYTIGFISASGPPELRVKTGKDLVTVFVSTTPNPTSGFLLFIPQEEIIHLDMTAEEGMKLIISGGIIAPDYLPEGTDDKQGKSIVPNGN